MKNIMRFFIAVLFFVVTNTIAQSVDWNGTVAVTGQYTTEENAPFWFYANTHHSVGERSNFSGLAGIDGIYTLSSKSELEAGVYLYYRDNISEEFQRRDLYLKFTNTWLKATLGSKTKAEIHQGLSASNKNFLLSGNARPLGGILLEANQPIKISSNFALDWGIGHYQLNDNRFIEDVRVHYKRLGVIVSINEKSKITAQLQHFAQWAGTSSEFGALPNNFAAFVDVFFAKEGDETAAAGEVTNAVGNHLGSYLLDYTFDTRFGKFSLYHEHPFEDGSGTRLANFPDGVWGLYFEPEQQQIFTGFSYEYIDTSNQGVGNQLAGSDNYFNNNLYRSGWSYEGQVIGLPFILYDRDITITPSTPPIISNRTRLHHFGFSGTINKINWEYKSTVVTHLGTYNKPFATKLSLWHNYASLLYRSKKHGAYSLFFGYDSSNVTADVFGAGFNYTYNF